MVKLSDIDLKDWIEPSKGAMQSTQQKITEMKKINGEDAIRKFLYYKRTGRDADSCPKAIEFEKKLLETLPSVEFWEKNGLFSNNKKQKLTTDTCFSSFQIITSFVKQYHLTDEIMDIFHFASGNEPVTNNKLKMMNYAYPDVISALLSARLPRKLYDSLQAYVRLTHTLGNIILVPEGCNTLKNNPYHENFFELFEDLKKSIDDRKANKKHEVYLKENNYNWYTFKDSEEDKNKKDVALVFGTMLADEKIQNFDLTRACVEQSDKDNCEESNTIGKKNKGRSTEPRPMTAKDLEEMSKLIIERNNELSNLTINEKTGQKFGQYVNAELEKIKEENKKNKK